MSLNQTITFIIYVRASLSSLGWGSGTKADEDIELTFWTSIWCLSESECTRNWGKIQGQEENISNDSQYSIVMNSASSGATIYQQGDTGKVT